MSVNISFFFPHLPWNPLFHPQRFLSNKNKISLNFFCSNTFDVLHTKRIKSKFPSPTLTILRGLDPLFFISLAFLSINGMDPSPVIWDHRVCWEWTWTHIQAWNYTHTHTQHSPLRFACPISSFQNPNSESRTMWLELVCLYEFGFRTKCTKHIV